MRFAHHMWLIYYISLLLFFHSLLIVIVGGTVGPRTAKRCLNQGPSFFNRAKRKKLRTLIQLLALENIMYCQKSCIQEAVKRGLYLDPYLQQGPKAFDLRSEHWASGISISRYLQTWGTISGVKIPIFFH